MIIVGRPGPGKYFGELALQHNPNSTNKSGLSKDSVRKATITTIKPSVFAIMHKTDYRQVLNMIDARKNERLI